MSPPASGRQSGTGLYPVNQVYTINKYCRVRSPDRTILRRKGKMSPPASGRQLGTELYPVNQVYTINKYCRVRSPDRTISRRKEKKSSPTSGRQLSAGRIEKKEKQYMPDCESGSTTDGNRL